MLLVMAQTVSLCHFFWQHVPNVHYFSQWYSVLILGFAPISNDHVRLGNRTISVNLRKCLSVYEHFSTGMTIETVLYLVP